MSKLIGPRPMCPKLDDSYIIGVNVLCPSWAMP